MVKNGQGTLIVGASQAGLHLATTLRDLGDEEAITLVGAEAHAPYQRPPLSKEFLTGSATRDALAFRTSAFYSDARIGLILGERVTAVQCEADGGVALTSAGREMQFDRLALTVGARPRRLVVAGCDLDGIIYLRELQDAEELRARLATATRVVVVGGGFIGLEAAAAARALGKSVTVVEAADRLVARAVAPVVSDFYLQAHTRRGVDLLLSTGVVGFGGDSGAVCTVQLSDGREIPSDLVIVGIGVLPRTELAEQLGLEVDGGIVVDAHARTSRPFVVSAGDCTVLPDPLTGVGRLRLESVQSAVAQAGIAASTLLGRDTATRIVPWFWSTQGDLHLQIAGLSAGHDHHVVRGDPDSEHFSVLYYKYGRLIAVDAINNPVDYMVVRKALGSGSNLPLDDVADASTPLKSLVVTPS